MFDRRTVVIIILVLVAALAAGGYWLLTPKIVSILPEQDATDVFQNSPIQITFSTAIKPEGVEKLLVMDPNTTGIYQVIGNTLVFTPSVPWDQDQIVKVTVRPGIKSTLGMPLITGRTWQFTTRHPWLLFQLDDNTHSDVYSVDPKGLVVTKLDTEAGSILDYTITADHQLYYSTVLPPDGSIIRKLNLLNQSVDDILTCPNAICTQLRISPDLNTLIYHKADRSDSSGTALSLWMQKLSGEKPEGEPVLAGIKDHITRDPSWSSSGWLAFYDETSVASQFYYPPGGQRVSLANDTGEPGSWSADGTTYAAPDINYSSGQANTPLYYSQIILYYPQSSTTSELTRDNRMEDLLPTFSPIGNQLVLARRFLNAENWTPGRQIWVMNGDGTNPRPLTKSPVDNHLGFAWSPKGDLLAYLRFNTASLTSGRELWLMDMAKGTSEKILMEAYNLQWLP
jgi:hypothetical protein